MSAWFEVAYSVLQFYQAEPGSLSGWGLETVLADTGNEVLNNPRSRQSMGRGSKANEHYLLFCKILGTDIV